MTDDGRQVRLASIGLGWWGNMLASAAKQSASLVACYARNPGTRELFAGKHGCRPFGDITDLWADPEIDGVIIATPHGVRESLIRQAASAGKHVFVEKPLALTAAEARSCSAATEAAGVILQVGHNKRRQTGNRLLKAAVQAGELGQVQHIESNISGPLVFKPDLPEWRKDPADLPAGGMTPLGVHMIDTIHYLAGGVSRVMAMSKRVSERLNVDDVTAVLLDLKSGPLAYLGTLMASGPVNTVAVFGTEGAAWSEQDGAKFYRQKRGEMDRHETPVETIDTLADEMAEFVDCIRTGKAPETGALEGVAVVEVLEAIVKSATTGTEVVIKA